MADFITHGLIGAASNPTALASSAVVGNACDAGQVLAALILSVKKKRLVTNIWEHWEDVPVWVRHLNRHLHSLWYPLFALFASFWAGWEQILPYIMAWLSHVVLDAFTHDEIACLAPFSEYVFSFGRTFHSWENMKQGTWIVVLAMIAGAFGLGIITKAWGV